MFKNVLATKAATCSQSTFHADGAENVQTKLSPSNMENCIQSVNNFCFAFKNMCSTMTRSSCEFSGVFSGSGLAETVSIYESIAKKLADFADTLSVGVLEHTSLQHGDEEDTCTMAVGYFANFVQLQCQLFAFAYESIVLITSSLSKFFNQQIDNEIAVETVEPTSSASSHSTEAEHLTEEKVEPTNNLKKHFSKATSLLSRFGHHSKEDSGQSSQFYVDIDNVVSHEQDKDEETVEQLLDKNKQVDHSNMDHNGQRKGATDDIGVEDVINLLSSCPSRNQQQRPHHNLQHAQCHSLPTTRMHSEHVKKTQQQRPFSSPAFQQQQTPPLQQQQNYLHHQHQRYQQQPPRQQHHHVPQQPIQLRQPSQQQQSLQQKQPSPNWRIIRSSYGNRSVQRRQDIPSSGISGAPLSPESYSHTLASERKTWPYTAQDNLQDTIDAAMGVLPTSGNSGNSAPDPADMQIFTEYLEAAQQLAHTGETGSSLWQQTSSQLGDSRSPERPSNLQAGNLLQASWQQNDQDASSQPISAENKMRGVSPASPDTIPPELVQVQRRKRSEQLGQKNSQHGVDQ